MAAPLPSRTCVSCGRSFNWRKKWARDWESVRYCSQACRRAGVREADRRLESLIIELLASGPRNHSIAPSEVARRVSGENQTDLLESVRRAARRLAAAGRVEVTQNGRPVNPDRARGEIRIRTCPKPR